MPKSKIRNQKSEISAIAAIACVLATTSFAAEQVVPPEVVICDGPPFAAELTAIHDDTLAFRTPDGTDHAVPWRDLVRWAHPSEPRAVAKVLLTDGSQLVVAENWAADVTLKWSANSLAVETTHFGRIEIPTQLVDAIWFADDKSETLQQPAANEDVVLLTNSDRLTGQIFKLDSREVSLNVADETVTMPTARVTAIRFRPSARAGASEFTRRGGPPAAPLLALGLDDGSLLYVGRATADAQRLEFALACGLQLADENSSVGTVAFLQTLGNRASYLSDLDPADYVHTPYLEIPWNLANDRTVQGELLQAGGKRYLKGLGLHSASRLTYRLDGTAKRFAADVALDDAAGKQGSVEFRIYLARGGQWQEAYRSAIVRGGDMPQSVSVDLEGAGALMLVVDYADRGDERDYADWLDARLIK